MRTFDQQLLRLKQQLDMTEDQAVAAALSMSKAAFADRKRRGAFPVDKLKALAADRPELHLDVKYVLTGVSDELERRLAAVGATTAIASKIKDKQARYAVQQEAFEAIVGVLNLDEQQLLHCYRRADEKGKTVLLTAAITLAADDGSATSPDKKGVKR
jgi:hypothetical protein